MENFDRHNTEIHQNLLFWQKKKLLHRIYTDFYREITRHINKEVEGKIVEIGSGIGNLKMILPDCVCTDAFANPWIDQVENAYRLSFEDRSVSNLILFDVWHHLQYPKCVLEEFNRVLKPQGRIIIFEPYISMLGGLVYGVFHKEPIGWFSDIQTEKRVDVERMGYYAAQGNATRMFCSSGYRDILSGFSIAEIKKWSALSYVMSGGYSGRQLYPSCLYRFLKCVEKIFDWMPFLFATRMLVVLEKKR